MTSPGKGKVSSSRDFSGNGHSTETWAATSGALGALSLRLKLSQ